MVVYGLKPRFRRMLRPVLRGLERFHPNTISAFAVVCAAAAGVALWAAPQRAWLYLVVPVLLFLRIAFNALDGMVAQARDMASPTGEMVNEFSDRVNDTLIFTGLAASGAVDPLLAAAALVGVLLVAYLGILPRAAGGERRYDGPAGKADRMLLLGVGCIAAFTVHSGGWATPGQALTWTLWLLLALLAITAVVRWWRAWRAFRGAGA